MSNFNRSRKKQFKEAHDDFEQKVVDLARVTRVMAGGKRMRFRASVIVGNKKGQVGVGVAKGADVSLAVDKATVKAKKELIIVPMVNDTIPHKIQVKYCSAQVMLKPAALGRGLIAGGPVRLVLELAGVKNIVAKMQGSKNKISNIRAVIKGLSLLRKKEVIDKMKESK